MQTKYRMFIENHVIQNFAELMIRVKNTEASVADMGSREVVQNRFQRWNNNRQPFPKRQREINVVETNTKKREAPPPIPLEKNRLEALVKAWIEDGEVVLRPIERQPTLEEQRSPKFCLFYRNTSHFMVDCFVLRKIYHEKVRKGEVIQEAEKNPLPNYGQINTCIAAETDPEPIIVEETGDCSEDLTQETEIMDSLMKTKEFKNLFEALEFDKQAQVEATSAIIEISKKFGEQCCVISKAIGKMARQNVDTLTFARRDATVLGFNYNKPLYVEAKVNGVKFKQALVDNGSSVNLMSYQTFKATGIPEKKLVPHNVPLTTFASSSFSTKGHVNVDLQVGPLRAPTKFYVIDADVSYHILLGRLWIHKNYVVPSTLHQCLKAIKGRKEVLIPGTKAPFSQEEVHWVEATFFDNICNNSIEFKPR